MCAANAFNLSRLRSHSPSRRNCSLAVALHARSHGLGLAEVHVGMNMRHAIIVKYLNALI